MFKADKTILRETTYIAVLTAVFSILMQAVFIALDKWNYTVILGNVLGAVIMILNFFFMGISVQKAVAVDEKEAKKIMKLSQSLRTLLIFVAVVIGVVLPFFSTLATIIPLFFPRIAVALRPLWKENKTTKEVPLNNESK